MFWLDLVGYHCAHHGEYDVFETCEKCVPIKAWVNAATEECADFVEWIRDRAYASN